MWRLSVGLSVACACFGSLLNSAAGADQRLPWRVPDGFEATLFADDDLATGITALAIDPWGRVVVAGPSYIKTLHDVDKDGRAEAVTVVSAESTIRPGGMTFLINNKGELALACLRERSLVLLYDANRDGKADPSETKLVELLPGDFGVHGLCQGPDGALYVACGSEAGFDKLATTLTRSSSPVLEPKLGTILRVSAGEREVVADGFCNPGDVAFTAAGNLLTVDVDNRPDLGLPWYAPTRLYDVAVGRNHGWRVAGKRTGWFPPAYDPRAVERAAELGSGVPTGLVTYRHRQFPEKYRGVAFAALWDQGRVDYLSLTNDGATLRGKPEPFFEIVGESGLAPIDLAVGLEGDLFVACGGNGTRGAVIRIRHQAGHAALPDKLQVPTTLDEALRADQLPDPLDIRDVLRADQPDEAWSRRRWIAAATKLGRDAFFDVITDPKYEVADQVRAVEILRELYFDEPQPKLFEALKLARPELSARVAWSLSREKVSKEQGDALAELTFHADPRVRLAAWTAWRFRSVFFNLIVTKMPNYAAEAETNLPPRVRYHLERNALREPLPGVAAPNYDAAQYAAMVRLKNWENPKLGTPPIVTFATQRFVAAKDANDKAAKLRAIRDLQDAIGGLFHDDKPGDLFEGYSWSTYFRGTGGRPDIDEAVVQLSAAFPSGDADLDRELSRLLNPYWYEPSKFVQAVAAKWTKESEPAEDLHYLIVAAQRYGAWPVTFREQIADTLLALDAKLAARRIHVEPIWSSYLGTLYEQFARRDDVMHATLVNRPTFGRAVHAVFLPYLKAELRPLAAERISTQLQRDEATRWTPELIDVVLQTNDEKKYDLLRKLWPDSALQAKIFPILVDQGDRQDRPKFVECLTNPRPEIVSLAARSLQRSAANLSDADLAAAIRGLRQMCTVPEARQARTALTTLIGLRADKVFEIVEPTWDESFRDVRKIRALYQPVFLWYSLADYQAASQERAPSGVAAGAWRKKLLLVEWETGDVARGRALFEKKQCDRCHMGGSRLGPDLDGATARYSHSELFATVFEPSRFVPPKYRPMAIEATSGKTHVGIPAYETAGLVLLQTGADSTVRLRAADMVAKRESVQSIMPLGLLNDFTPQDFADLHAFLASIPLKKPTGAVEP